MTEYGSILIVDDDQDIRDVLRFILEAQNYRVDVAVDGVDAWNQLNDGMLPAVILLDLMLPRMDGEEFLKKLRESPYSEVPVIILSGHCAAQQKADELKANGCLTK